MGGFGRAPAWQFMKTRGFLTRGFRNHNFFIPRYYLSTSDFQSEVGEVFSEIGGELPAKFGRRFSSFFCCGTSSEAFSTKTRPQISPSIFTPRFWVVAGPHWIHHHDWQGLLSADPSTSLETEKSLAQHKDNTTCDKQRGRDLGWYLCRTKRHREICFSQAAIYRHWVSGVGRGGGQVAFDQFWLKSGKVRKNLVKTQSMWLKPSQTPVKSCVPILRRIQEGFKGGFSAGAPKPRLGSFSGRFGSDSGGPWSVTPTFGLKL